MSETSRFIVVLTEPQQREPMALAKALAAARKTPLQDQIIKAKGAWGIAAENLSQAEAENLAAELKKSNLACLAMPAASLVELPEVKPLPRMEPSAAEGLVLIAAAAFNVTSTTTKTVKEGPSAAQKVLSTAILLGTGLPIKIGGRVREVEKKQTQSDRVFYLDLLYKDSLRRWRVDAQRFDYSFLKERKGYQVFANFKSLIGDLAGAAPAAWRNHGVRVLLENKPLQTMGYESLADLDRESRWLLTLQRMATGRSH